MGRVLVIDDDQLVREMVCQMLHRLGHETREFSGGQAVLDGAVIDDIDVVITDIFMPNGEGMETIRTLRRSQPGLRLIAMSGAGGWETGNSWLTMAEALGADASLNKPFTSQELSKALGMLAPTREPSESLEVVA